MNELFFALIRVAIGTENCLPHTPSPEEWKELYRMAKKQSLLGICFAGVQKLQSQRQHLPEKVYDKWMAITATIQMRSIEHRNVLKMVTDLLYKKGYRAIFMKGLTCAERYPEPLLRQCGDIDFVLEEKHFTKILNSLEEIAKVDHNLVHEHHGMAHIGNVQLEPHYKIHNYQNPCNDRTMRSFQKKLLSGKDRCMIKIGQAEVEKFPLEFEGMYIVSHMVNHVYEEGLGMRQVMDFYYWIKKLPSNSRFNSELYHAYLGKMHMRRAARIFTHICESYLGLDSDIFDYKYTKKEKCFVNKMANDIIDVGNFAKHADKQPKAGIHAYLRTIIRTYNLGYLCPSEAIWWPISKFFRFFWRIYVKTINHIKK